MTRLRYGPRFKTSLVGVGARYDKRLDLGLPPAAFAPRTREQELLRIGAVHATQRTRRGIVGVHANEIEADPFIAAEGRLIERTMAALKLIETGLDEINGVVPGSTRIEVRVSRHALMDVIDRLRKILTRARATG